jgi:AcrR family transcriptional regulator
VLKTAASSRRSRNRVSVEQRRIEILEATRAVVLEKGFGGTRIKDVSDALGVSTGLVHYHFESKDELLAETMRYAADADIRRLEKTVAAGSDPIERLDRVLREYLPGPRDQSWTLWIDAWGEALHKTTMSRAKMLEHTRAVAAAELGLRRDDFPAKR